MNMVASGLNHRRNRVFRLSIILPVLMVGLTLAACCAVGVIGYLNGQAGLEKAATGELGMLARARTDLMNAKLDSVRADLSNMASGGGVVLALTTLNQSLDSLQADEPALREYFQAEGSTPEQRSELSGEGNKTVYSWRHLEIHQAFLSSWKNGGYGDIYVLNADGVIVYSVTKSGEFLSSVSSEGIAETGLSAAFNTAIKAPEGEQFSIDFSTYNNGADYRSMFLAEPVYLNKTGATDAAGVVVIRLDVGFFDAVLADRDGLGETGQVFLAGDNGRVLSNMPLASVPTALVESVDYDAVNTAIGGSMGNGVGVGADGVDRLVYAYPLSFLGRDWSVVAERTVEETMKSVDTMRWNMILGTLVTVGVATVIALLFSRSVTRPLTTLVVALRAIASGNLSTEIKAAERGDEIGEIGQAVVQIRQNAVEDQERRAAIDAENARSESERRQAMLSELAAEFEASVGQVVSTVRESATNLMESAEEMRGLTDTAGSRSERATELSNRTMEEVQMIAAASDQLFSSITQISELIARSAMVAQSATARAEATNTTVRSLAEAADRIGEVVTLISAIADQTNLLALNATIEAARAGDAGRGFAVVASEVKELAAQTGRATGEIQEQIDAIRGATEDAVNAIADIQKTITEITTSVTEVSSAVEEQSAATQGIVDNTQRAAAGTTTVSSDMTDVRSATEQTTTAAQNFVSAATALSTQANSLDEEVRGFLSQVRSA